MFKNVLRIAVQEACPPRTRGRPALVGFDDAYDDILRVVRTGMQWRYLRPTAAVHGHWDPVVPYSTAKRCAAYVPIGRVNLCGIPLRQNVSGFGHHVWKGWRCNKWWSKIVSSSDDEGEHDKSMVL